MGCSGSKQTVAVEGKKFNHLVRLGKEYSAVEVLASIHSGKTTAVNVVKAYLDRIDEINP